MKHILTHSFCSRNRIMFTESFARENGAGCLPRRLVVSSDWEADDGANPSVANMQRTLARMAASTPDKPATVRWMFYGQSITAQPWTRLVEQDLARRFPSVNFVFHNPAIGGFTSPALIRMAEHDLYPWYPDLLVFHLTFTGNRVVAVSGGAGEGVVDVLLDGNQPLSDFRDLVRKETWTEKWPDASGKTETRSVTAEIWTAAMQASLDAQGLLHIPARKDPYYLDGPLILKSGQSLTADPQAEIRLKPGCNTCMVRKANTDGLTIQNVKLNVPVTSDHHLLAIGPKSQTYKYGRSEDPARWTVIAACRGSKLRDCDPCCN